MWKWISRLRLVGFWFAAVAVIIAWIIATGVHLAISTAVVLLTLCLIPPVILLLIWRGSAPPTVGELLYAVNKQSDGR